MVRHSTGARALAATLLAVAALAGVLGVRASAGVQSAVREMVSTVCSDNRWCVKLTNTSSAPRASALVGEVTVNTNTNPNPRLPAFAMKGGIKGVDTATNSLDTNAGVIGMSSHGFGVVGLTTFDSSANQFAPVGVVGLDLSKTVNGNAGIVGASLHNVGIAGFSNGTVTSPSGGSAIGVIGGAEHGLAGVLGTANGNPPNENTIPAGVAGASSNKGNGVYAQNASRDVETLVAVNTAKGPLIGAYGDAKQGIPSRVLLLDTEGNLSIAGNLTTGGPSQATQVTLNGQSVVTYSAQQSTRTLEDVGEAQLVGGHATVRLDRTFASAIDPRSYLVFITPQGDAGTLYVAQKTALGFIVRERDGTSNVAFDYRIVGLPVGSPRMRLPRYVAPQDGSRAAKAETIRTITALVSQKLQSLNPILRQ